MIYKDLKEKKIIKINREPDGFTSAVGWQWRKPKGNIWHDLNTHERVWFHFPASGKVAKADIVFTTHKFNNIIRSQNPVREDLVYRLKDTSFVFSKTRLDQEIRRDRQDCVFILHKEGMEFIDLSDKERYRKLYLDPHLEAIRDYGYGELRLYRDITGKWWIGKLIKNIFSPFEELKRWKPERKSVAGTRMKFMYVNENELIW